MCQTDKKVVCTHPEKLKGKPGECSPEQMAECHPKTKERPAKDKK